LKYRQVGDCHAISNSLMASQKTLGFSPQEQGGFRNDSKCQLILDILSLGQLSHEVSKATTTEGIRNNARDPKSICAGKDFRYYISISTVAHLW
jgi:hypothetical protein